MTGYRVLRRLLLVCLSIVVASCLDGRSEGPEVDVASLRLAFPAQAAKVLEGRTTFAALEDGFATRAPRGGLRAVLPKAGDGLVRFHVDDRFEARVREVGAAGPGAIAEGAIAYARPGGTSYWAATDAGYEEWLWLQKGVATANAPAVTWQLEGARARQAGDAVEVVDERGAARIRVTAPAAYAAGGRAIGVKLAARGAQIDLWVDAGGEEVLVDPSWASAGTMPDARANHTATLLSDGNVLVTGGDDGSSAPSIGAIAAAAIYDPATGTWAAAAPMPGARVFHTATLLASGKVLIAGGLDPVTSLKTAVIYDPTADTWAPAASMTTGRAAHTATLLPNGTVLVAGGDDTTSEDPAVGTAEIYDPATDAWSPGGTLVTARYSHTATLLPNGKVLIAAGAGNTSDLATAEAYDPQTNTWTASGNLSAAREEAAAVLLANGEVLIAGGRLGVNAVEAVDLYDPAADTWSVGAPMISQRFAHTATLLGDGRVLIAAGSDGAALATTELYDPMGGTWTAGATLSGTRFSHRATLLPSGDVLVTGGLRGPTPVALDTAEIYGLSDGEACTSAAQCASGFCVDGVCCDTACDAGPCDACSVAAGGAADGTCTLLTGPACDDGNACSKSDVCTNGVCGGTSYTCAPTSCQASSTCDGNGGCTIVNEASGAACPDDGNACTADACDGAGTCLHPNKADGTSCGAGQVCAGGSCASECFIGGALYPAGTINPANACLVCMPASSTTAWSNVADGTSCNDGNACTKDDVCTAGSCGGAAYTCTPASCQASSTCDGNGGCTIVNKPSGATCPDDGNPCSDDTCDGAGTCTHAAIADGTVCGSGVLCQGGSCGPKCQIGGQLYAAGTINPANACQQCAPAIATTSWSSRADGTACDDGNACTKNDACTAGACGGTAYTCAPGTCDASSTCDGNGGCVVTHKGSGAACADDGNPCTADTCDGAGTCTHATLADGTSCAAGQICQGGACAAQCFIDGVFVPAATTNPANPCEICAPGTSAMTWTSKVDGVPCSDGDACTQTDVCHAGVCVGSNPVTCSAIDPCHDAGTCDPATGACSNPPKIDGTSCDDGNACTQTDTCQAGVCTGGNPVICAASNSCHDVGTCDKATGVCSNPVKADGAACDDGDACTQADTCQSGVCVGGNPKSCAAVDECHLDGTCDTATGDCSKPAKNDGEACSNGTCQAGVCSGAPDGGTGGTGGTGGSGGSGGSVGTGGSGGSGGAVGTGGASTSTASSSSGSGSGSGSGSSSSGKTADQSGGCGCRVAGEGSERGPIGVVIGLVLAAGISRRRVRRAA